MNLDSTPGREGSEKWAPLTDLSEVPLDTPVPGDDRVVDQALRRVLRSLHDRDGVISSFGSFITED
ncbi:hypothetical protein [Actinoplanes derwentensis]|uniref:FXSXX-COOH protein n=1 Tax=Actinoplanes derwentensis TaxID=113562 RepID=A0A1H1WYE2_9ACTN|nr:hypothetical protein [Actinoplanes derwentensis]GID85779.1 hypothetical protein Ade03nite_47030 [Actinoplanes derwentensis]SDT02167.1 hypothetical protein SAMN04489716_2278 [Actinoplanes derwentensis]